MSGERQFRATLERDSRSLGWIVAHVPFDARLVWPGMIRTRVQGRVEGPFGGVNFRTSLFHATAAKEQDFLLVNQSMQKGAGVSCGQEASFTLAPDLEERAAELPDELDCLLDEAPGLRAWYAALSEYSRRELGKWISAVKGSDARCRRAQQTAERLLATMEAEIELPPRIKRALCAKPRAMQGWLSMPPSHRRAELLAIFSYQSPEAQERRLAKLVEKAEARED